ncbi:SGNH/GDSL hydrolase family protein [Changchengzhania lutea]|uniref:SGNH/GDSL hydrolase family protein n=1 Tax=Changchengzhania lutea TaxID=2049305 RepID=UPI00115D81A8|nr:SGNH/GDSL hydrolase family protein [Changchengzhania lutea]
MKSIKYIFLSAVLITFTACSEDDYDYTPNPEPVPAFTAGSADFTNYVAVGASFTAGFTDGALFIASQQNSFPNILSQQFGSANFSQPLMNDNIGGLLFGGNIITNPRLFFNGSGPAVLPAIPTTETTNILSGSFSNMGVPGAKSFHFVAPGYGNLAGVPVGAANPYFARMASSTNATIIGDAVAQNPTFFTLSEVGGNDVLGFATSGGSGVDQTGNLDPATYGGNDITDPNVFAQVFSGQVTALTANGAKGVVANVPYITNLPHFTTVPFAPLDPTNPDFGPQIPTLNTVFGALNPIFQAIDPSRVIVFSETAASPVVIKDESLPNIAAQISGALAASPAFPVFLSQFGLDGSNPTIVQTVAGLFGSLYGQARQATEDDLLVLPSSSIIGTVNTAFAGQLALAGLSQAVAGQFAVEGVTLPLEDKWVLLPSEQLAIRTATDAYNATIASVASANSLALVDFKGILEEASTTGISDGDFTLTTDLVSGGLVSLDGVHLTARGYAIMANKFLEAIDTTYGSNFIAAGVKANPGDYPTNYSPNL